MTQEDLIDQKWCVVYRASKDDMRMEKEATVFAVDRGEAREVAMAHLKERGWSDFIIKRSYRV